MFSGKPQFDGVSRNALVIMAVIASGAALWLLRGVLTQLALAVFLAVTIDGFSRVLERRLPKFPKAAALPTAVALTILILIGVVWLIAQQGMGFADQVQGYGPRLEALLASTAHSLGVQNVPSLSELISRANPGQYAQGIAKQTQSILSDTFFVLIYLAFLIASRRGFRRKIVAMFPHNAEREEAVVIFQRIRNGVEQYLWVQTVTGLMIAAGSFICMYFVGLDNALFWAFLIFLASYIPIIGGVVGVALPPLFALVQFPSIIPAIIIAVVLQSVQFIVGNVVQPKMQGDSLNIDPVVVLLSLAFWGLIWGMPGMFLSTPLTVMAMIILAQFKGSHWIAVLLSANGNPAGAHGRHNPMEDIPGTPRAAAAKVKKVSSRRNPPAS
ncbi:MAG: AI-2E family transporter [Caulobacter sp.]|nr:AI-2E family transporter [Caulobacter sp.]